MGFIELQDDDRKRIEEGFNQLGIEPASYPNYQDPYILASSFEICSLYRDIPLTSDSCTVCPEEPHAKLERDSRRD